jgi:hypothetical protein
MSRFNKTDGHLVVLSCLTLGNGAGKNQSKGLDEISTPVCGEEMIQAITRFERQDYEDLWALANSHHVIMRALPQLHQVLRTQGNPNAECAGHALKKEQKRIDSALSFLGPICDALRSAGDVIVIKSLDHWPDLGSDLDLYSNAKSADIVAIMRDRFHARPAERSWGDRLANKWNFIVPGLPELVEVHVGRLGQTGEQVAITDSLVKHASTAQFGSYTFLVPAPEDRIVISTLQRMYRHFYIRLCDIVDNGRLMDAGAVDYLYLQSLGRSAGLWSGLSTYLVIVSEYIKSYRGEGISLPAFVMRAARFGNERVRFRRKFLRIPIFPQAAGLYVSEWERLLRNGELQNTLRLSLLPGLAAAAAVEMKLTGSDKGIW